MSYQLFVPPGIPEPFGLEGAKKTRVSISPDEEPGVLYHFVPPVPNVEWVVLTDGTKIGIHPDGLEPVSLQRPQFLDGTKVLLGDGRDWVIPDLHSVPGDIKLLDGVWRNVPTDPHARTLLRTVESYRLVLDEAFGQSESSDEENTPRDQDMMNLIMELVGFNYWLTPAVASHLGMFNVQGVISVLSHASGYIRDTQEDQQLVMRF